MDWTSGALWGALLAIIVANILLSGDNAVVIAMAARSLKPEHQKKAIIWGSAAAIVMRAHHRSGQITHAAVPQNHWWDLAVLDWLPAAHGQRRRSRY
jgi:predicted tellurium resistance membrane protein TerC